MSRTIRLSGLLFCLFILLGSALPHAIFAQGGNTLTVVTGAANIRSGPGENTTILGIVYAGEVLTATGRSDTGWWRVNTAFGTGWISGRITVFRGDYASIPVTNEPAGVFAPSTVVAANGPVKVYSNPNESSFVIYIIPSGSSAPIVGRTGDGAWLQVTTPAGNGFVSYISIARRGPLDEVALVNDPGPSFRGPTVQLGADQAVINDAGSSIGGLGAGTTIPVIGRNADNSRWMVAVDTIGIGWINVANVTLAGPASDIPLRAVDTRPGPVADNAVHATAIVIAERKLFYARPSFTVVMLDGGRGTEVGIIGRSSDGLWLQGIVRNNVIWMVFSSITLNGDMANIPVVDVEPVNRNHIVINTYALNVRSGPGAQYTSLATVSGGSTFRTTGVSPDRVWWRIEGDFGVGWVRTRHILFRGDVNTVPVVTEPVGEIAPATAVTKGNVAVYTAPDGITQAGALTINTEYVITGHNVDWTWYQLDTPLGLVWIRAGDIYFRGDFDVVPLVQ